MFDGVNRSTEHLLDAQILPSGAPPQTACAASFSKRGLDMVLALALIVFLLPVLIPIALLIRLDSAGPVLFRQRRTGLNGKVFDIYKFRSMTVLENGQAVIQARANDRRVTRIGRLLRKTSLDELPQLINIIRGDMSFVGPRPHAMIHDAQFAAQVAHYDDRFEARPGLTGLAQVRGYRGEIRRRADLENRLEADLEYIRTWSLTRDAIIVARTLPLILGDRRAY